MHGNTFVDNTGCCRMKASMRSQSMFAILLQSGPEKSTVLWWRAQVSLYSTIVVLCTKAA